MTAFDDAKIWLLQPAAATAVVLRYFVGWELRMRRVVVRRRKDDDMLEDLLILIYELKQDVGEA